MSVTLSAQYTARSAADPAGVCQPIPLCYSDKVYTTFFGYPFAVGTEQATLVTNRTGLALEATPSFIRSYSHIR